MYANKYLFLLLLTSHLLFSAYEDKPTFPSSSQLQEYNIQTNSPKNDPDEIVIKKHSIKKEHLIAFRNRTVHSLLKHSEKLNKEFERSKTMACRTGMGIGFLILIKTLDPLSDNFTDVLQHNFVIAGSVFCLISFWETLKAGYNVARHAYKIYNQQPWLAYLEGSIAFFDKNSHEKGKQNNE